MSDREFIVVGGGGHAGVVVALLRAAGKPVRGYLETDGRPDRDAIHGAPFLGDDSVLETVDAGGISVAVGIGNGDGRRQAFERLRIAGFDLPALVHPGAIVDPSASLAAGCQVMAGAVVQASASIAGNVLLNTGCRVDHDCRLEAHASIGPGAVLCGGVRVSEAARIGANATVIERVQIGAGSEIAAGAVVVDDIAAGSRVAGVPAREMQE